MTSLNELLRGITEIDEQLAKNKVVIDKYSGKTTEELGPEIFDKLTMLCKQTVSLMVVRTIMVRQVQDHYGITIV